MHHTVNFDKNQAFDETPYKKIEAEELVLPSLE
jgi:hypothetical protein